jgi:phosphoribosylformylglycinamidine synthase
MSVACKFLNVPVISGNVSFYNESQEGAVHPTPVVGMVGLIEPMASLMTPWFKEEGDAIFLLGPLAEGKQGAYGLGGSEYAAMYGSPLLGDSPAIDLRLERGLGLMLLEASAKGLLKSAHDCAEGGLGVALAECCLFASERKVGASLMIPSKLRGDFLLFNETQGRVIVSARRTREVLNLAHRHKVPITFLGTVGGSHLKIKNMLSMELSELSRAWSETLPKALKENA